MAGKALNGVALRPHASSLVGALGGLLSAAGRDLPLDYLSGVTGHAFRLTVDLVFSPDGPSELNFHDIFPLWENLGAWFKRSVARPDDPAYAAAHSEAVERLQVAVDGGRPAIAYGLLGQPEYGLVVGYDDQRLACLTPDHPTEPLWMELAGWPATEQGVGRAEAIILLDLAPAFDRRQAEVASLRAAVEQFWAPPGRDMWLHHGQKAYELWRATLASAMPLHGPEPGLGHSYNLALLHRARLDAAAYLAELAERYPEAPSLEAAAQQYAQVAGVLGEAASLLPFPGEGIEEKRRPLAELLGQALAAERDGVDQIERALRALR